jgi:hypothetical protein
LSTTILSEVFDTYVSLLNISIDPTLSTWDPHAMLPQFGTCAAWYYIQHLCELAYVLTPACKSISFDCTASLPQMRSLETTFTASFQTFDPKHPSSLKDLTSVSSMNTSYMGHAPWTLSATTGPINSVNYHRLCRPLWPDLITLCSGHPLHPTPLCTPLAQQRAANPLGNPAPPALGASPTICINSNPIVKLFRFILAALFFAARECNSIQLRLSARMLCWLIYNGRTPIK